MFRPLLVLVVALLVASPAPDAEADAALVPLPSASAGAPWPGQEWTIARELPRDVDGSRLAAALEAAFAEPDPRRLRRTRAVVVVHDNQIVAERYAPGFSSETPLLGWSMTKSVTNALVGILVQTGRLALTQPADVPEWRAPGDPRGRITVDQLLRMSSGLAWDERTGVYGALLANAVPMLLGRGRVDMAAYAAARPLARPPDTHWNYSSGTSLILSGIIRRALGGPLADYHAFPHRALFGPLGMRSAILEVDGSGTFVGSSYMYATARDWARFGLLYLRDGVWDGRRLLPTGWADYTRTPSPTAARGEYGAHFWLNAGAPARGIAPLMPRVPRDAFFAWGLEHQYVLIVPSRDLVVVRLGLTTDWDALDYQTFLADIVAAFPLAGE